MRGFNHEWNQCGRANPKSFLSLSERIKVRGNGANSNLGYRTIPGPVEPGKSAGGARDSLNDTAPKPGHEK